MGNFLDNRLHIYSEEEFLSLPIDRRKDKAFVMSCLKRNGLLFKNLDSIFKSDLELQLVAIKQNAGVVDLLNKIDLDDIDFVLVCMQVNEDVYSRLPLHIKSQTRILEQAISDWGVDALWEMPIEVFKNIHMMLKALKGLSGLNEDLWSAVLNGAGSEAYFHKILIEQAYKKYGDVILGKDLKWIKSQGELKEIVEELLPDESWISYFQI
jgi:hypothetical protein